MADPAEVALAGLLSLREQGAQQLDPVGFRFLEALAGRTATCQGRLRVIVARRLQDAVDAYARRWASAAASHVRPRQSPQGKWPAQTPGAPLQALMDLNHYLREQSCAALGVGHPTDAVAHPDMKSVRQFRATWSRGEAQNRLRKAIASGPENAGPLNSHRLVLRALELMGEVSPHYVQRFMSHVDGLLLLDTLPKRTTSMAPTATKLRRRPSA